jgi:hypothetical protein
MTFPHLAAKAVVFNYVSFIDASPRANWVIQAPVATAELTSLCHAVQGSLGRFLAQQKQPLCAR